MFWGLKVEPNKWTPFVPPPDDSLRLHISQATLGGGIPDDKERIIVKIRSDDEEGESVACASPCETVSWMIQQMLPNVFALKLFIYTHGVFSFCSRGILKRQSRRRRRRRRVLLHVTEGDKSDEFNLCTMIGGVVETCGLDIIIR